MILPVPLGVQPGTFGSLAVLDALESPRVQEALRAGEDQDAPRRAARTCWRRSGTPRTGGRDLQALGVCKVAIPRRANPSATRRAVEHARGFRALVKWRTGFEGRISYLKRGYGWDRTRLNGRQGASIWCGHEVFTHNLVKISALAS